MFLFIIYNSTVLMSHIGIVSNIFFFPVLWFKNMSYTNRNITGILLVGVVFFDVYLKKLLFNACYVDLLYDPKSLA